MATRSTIAFLDEETGKVSQIYCHWDGYPDGVGETLVKHYNDADKIKELIALGSLSVLGEHIGTKQVFENRISDMCLAYHRDRGEALKINRFESIEDYLENLQEEEYQYIFIGDTWFVYPDNWAWRKPVNQFLIDNK